MPRGVKKCSDEEFIRLFSAYGAVETGKQLNMLERSVYRRRASLGQHIAAPSKPANKEYPWRVPLSLKNGTCLVGSDFHIWPGKESTCLRAFKKLCGDIRPDAVILNGDVMDFPRISRHPQNWESAPDPKEEIEAAQDHLHDIKQASKRGAPGIWTLGNHDARLEALYANSAPQMRGMTGVHLSDFFPAWQKAMSCFVNEGIDGGATMVKHRFKSGQAAPRANTLNAGVSMVTGHLHSQKVIPVSDYNPYDRYGVDTGCVADKDHRAFLYAEDAPLDWRSGFAILTYKDGRLMQPELVSKWDDEHVQWRGSLIKV